MSVCEIDLSLQLLPRRAVGLWRCCLGFGEEREGVEYLGSWAAAGKQGQFSMGVRLHSAWDSQYNWMGKNKIGCRSLRCSLMPPGGAPAKQAPASFKVEKQQDIRVKCQCHHPVLPGSAQTEKWRLFLLLLLLRMLYGEEKSVREAEIQVTRMPSAAKAQIEKHTTIRSKPLKL